MNSGRYVSRACIIPALETPITIRIGGSQQQLDAMIAETTVPILAIPSARPDLGEFAAVGSFDESVAPGDVLADEVQQFWASPATGRGSLDILSLLV